MQTIRLKTRRSLWRAGRSASVDIRYCRSVLRRMALFQAVGVLNAGDADGRRSCGGPPRSAGAAVSASTPEPPRARCTRLGRGRPLTTAATPTAAPGSLKLGRFRPCARGRRMSAMMYATLSTQPAGPVTTYRERAVALADEAMAVACSGWRRDRRCVDESGHRLAQPHPQCLHARYRYLLIRLQNGLSVEATSRS